MFGKIEDRIEDASYAFAHWLLRRYKTETVHFIHSLIATVAALGLVEVIVAVLTGPFIMALPCSFQCNQFPCTACPTFNPYMIFLGLTFVAASVLNFLISPIVDSAFDRVLKRGIWAET